MAEQRTEPTEPAEPTGTPAAGATAGAKAPETRAEPVDVHPPTRLERTGYRAFSGGFHGLAKLYFRLEIHGREHIPSDGPFVLAPVHRSNLDFILASTVYPSRMRYMGKASIWKVKPVGRIISLLGGFPVHRGTADRESLRTCLQVIENGQPLVMFP